jgi:hypothetical protein
MCAASIYGERFEEYTADFDAAVNRRDTARKRREIEQLTIPFKAWLDSVLRSNVFELFESVRKQLSGRLPWVWENAPHAGDFGMPVDGVRVPARLFDKKNDPKASFARIVADMGTLTTTFIDNGDLSAENVSRIKRVLEGLIGRTEAVFVELREVEDFFQPAVLEMVCRIANANDNPRKRTYTAGLLALTCKKGGRDKAMVQAPHNFRLPNRAVLDALKEALRVL